MKPNFLGALLHLFDAFEKLVKVTERTRRMFLGRGRAVEDEAPAG